MLRLKEKVIFYYKKRYSFVNLEYFTANLFLQMSNGFKTSYNGRKILLLRIL
ncbi:hypothetical protein LEP1GSC127_3797 [Leptospira kirschneri str. 200801925]|nr:hypothetical protein LEP1GSC127_3797 [Leptospira kirschneri str. 200801925]